MVVKSVFANSLYRNLCAIGLAFCVSYLGLCFLLRNILTHKFFLNYKQIYFTLNYIYLKNLNNSLFNPIMHIIFYMVLLFVASFFIFNYAFTGRKAIFKNKPNSLINDVSLVEYAMVDNNLTQIKGIGNDWVGQVINLSGENYNLIELFNPSVKTLIISPDLAQLGEMQILDADCWLLLNNDHYYYLLKKTYNELKYNEDMLGVYILNLNLYFCVLKV